MAWLKGSLSLLFILLITIVVCVPLQRQRRRYAMALLRLPLTGAPRRALTRRMDLAIDFWVSSNRFLVRALRLVEVEIDWPAELINPRCRDTGGTPAAGGMDLQSSELDWADILLLQLQNAFRPAIPPLKFFTKRELIWLPLAGPAMYLLGFPYVRRAGKAERAADPSLKHADRDSTLAACRVFRNHPTSVLIFLEGTRFTDAKRAARHSRFECLLNPRTGGLDYVLGGLRDEVEQLIDVTIAYPCGPPSFWAFLSGRCPRALMTVRAIDLDSAVVGDEPQARRQALQSFVERPLAGEGRQTGGLSGLLRRPPPLGETTARDRSPFVTGTDCPASPGESRPQSGEASGRNASRRCSMSTSRVLNCLR